MGLTYGRRTIYRVRQFVLALRAALQPLMPAELAEVRAYLPEAGRLLFSGMPSADQRHSLNVLRALRDAGHDAPALMQAALLHDCAKREGGVRLWHRVAMVLLKAFRPAVLACWASEPAPARTAWRYPMWAHLHHPQRSAELAAAAGCDPLAVALIRHHQDPPQALTGEPSAGKLLAALQAADDDN
jgi:hypothetical protein